jgi:hypothetical protein
VANILSALGWAPMHVFTGVLVGLAIVFGGANAPELSLAAMGVLIWDRVDVHLKGRPAKLPDGLSVLRRP